MYDSYKSIEVMKQDKVLIVRFNNPKKKNCMNMSIYHEMGNVFQEVAQDESVTVVVITGTGDFYSAGNDLNPSDKFDDAEAYKKNSAIAFNHMMHSLMECPQLVIALVNGPAIGIAATMLPFCDIVWASETAYFSTPFTKLGIVPEACSSILFPAIMGRSKAAEMLLLSGKMTAEEAYRYNLVSKLYKPSEVDSVIWPQIREHANSVPRGALIASKELFRGYERDLLYKALRVERKVLDERFGTEEFFNAVLNFATRKSKL